MLLLLLIFLGSLALLGTPASQDAPVASKLRAAGAVILGKANMSEWATLLPSPTNATFSLSRLPLASHMVR